MPSWDADLEAGELVAFADFWSWFHGVRERAHAEGATFRAYCYSRSAEQGQMTRLADRLGLRDEVDEFLASDEWVDLYDVVKAQLVTGRSMGLKVVAPLAGFEWRFDDAGGTLAMVKYDQAVDDSGEADDADGVGRANAQQWILDYNEDDVRATAALAGGSTVRRPRCRRSLRRWTGTASGDRRLLLRGVLGLSLRRHHAAARRPAGRQRDLLGGVRHGDEEHS